MCGFVLLLSAGDGRPRPGLAADMASRIAHRGPDDSGDFSENGFSVAFRRLAIFDLTDSSHQPMVSADGRHVIVFNGAIYNFIELRKELSTLGYVFHSTGDTEVLLAAYQEWGTDCLRRLNGMFAFVVYNRITRRIFAARDRFGVKPLFWYHDERGLAFASEIKAIRDSGYAELKPNWPVVASFLLEQQLDDSEETCYDGVRRVPAGCYFEGDARSEPAFRPYWSLEGVIASTEAGPDAVEEFAFLFDDAVRLRMRSDVPVGVFLSGGLDSTSIISSMARLSKRDGPGLPRLDALCYHDPAYNERALIAETLESTGATPCCLTPDEDRLWSSLDRHAWHQDEPVHSFTSVVTYQLAELAKERGLKVILNGQGADEVLAGYPSFFMDYWSELVRSGYAKRAYDEIEAFARGHGQSASELYRSVSTLVFKQMRGFVPGHPQLAARRRRARIDGNRFVSADVKSKWSPREVRQPLSLADSLRLAVERYPLPLFLRVEDRNAMAHGVEIRLPFLDHRLVTFAFRLSARWKLRGEYTKFVLREAMRGRIPDAVRQRAVKFGFPTSVNAWFRGSMYERFRDVLASRAVYESGVWNVAELERALTRHKNGIENLGNQFFDVAQFTAWYSLSHFGSTVHDERHVETAVVVDATAGQNGARAANAPHEGGHRRNGDNGASSNELGERALSQTDPG
jgi:asparagine synthase (glutamine-hydrolysing)